ncbi:MAG: hypothetical protein HY909_14730 [Deltaproteobacteria bacterium]|nr:hypothetical protein [Deltaproteobacteria bacterium]
MRTLKLPATLVYTVYLSTSCSSQGTPDAATDARADQAPADTSVTDSTPADTAVVDSAVADTGGRDSECMLGDTEGVGPRPGYECTPAAGAGAGVTCPTGRVCEASQCGAGCEGCQSALFCIPDRLPDGGRPERCARSTTCNGDLCGEGCRAVG